MKDALFHAFDEGRELEEADIAAAIRRTYPLSRTMRENILDMRKWAQYRARLASDESTEDLPESKDGAPKLIAERRNLFVRDGASQSDRTEGAP